MRTAKRRRSATRSATQHVLFSADSLLPDKLLSPEELRPSFQLSTIFDDCHNHVYANEGILKDKIYHEMVKLLLMKLFDERTSTNQLRFGITAEEYRSIMDGGKESKFCRRLQQLLHDVRAAYPTLVRDDSIRLGAKVLAYIVARLQVVGLSNTPGDIKGEAFQAFVSRHQRGDRGEFFTPHPIVKLAVDIMSPGKLDMVIDPACGSAGFLLEVISSIKRRFPAMDTCEYIRDRIRGLEFNPDVALAATIQMTFAGGNGSEIECCNALAETPQLNGKFDIVLTNPPFGIKGKVEETPLLSLYDLGRKWTRSHNGSWSSTNALLAGQSPDILFLEKCIKLLKPGGRMAIVLPDGLLQNPSNGYVRDWIRSHAKIDAVLSVPQEAFVPYGTGIKTSILLLQRNPANEFNKSFMARILKLGYDVKGQPVVRRDLKGKSIVTSDGGLALDTDIGEVVTAYDKFKNGHCFEITDCTFAVSTEELNSRLDVEHYLPSDKSLLERLRESGARRLGEIADVQVNGDDFRLVSNAEIRYIAISDVEYRSMQVVSQQLMKAYEAPSRATYRLKTGDIITAVSGASTGTERQATALISEDEDGAICSNGFAVIRNVRHVDPYFLLLYMRTQCFLRQVRRLMTGHAIPTISNEDLAKVLIAVPPQVTQMSLSKKVATILATRREALTAVQKLVADVDLSLNTNES